MKNTYIIIGAIVLIVAGVFIFGTNKEVEAPETSEINTNMPVPPEAGESPVPEMEVVKEFTVSGKNFSFTPSLITVQKGDKVKITFQNSAGFHDFVIDEYGVATKQTNAPTTEILEFTADKAGSFEYYCSVGTHKALGMKGILKVE
jgi:plastocyanin